MFRLLRFITLTSFVFTLIIVGLAVATGHLIPAGQQMVGFFPRKDQWTKIALISTNRQLTANRYLPVRVQRMQWSDDGQELMVIGTRNNHFRLYNLGYSPANNDRRWEAVYGVVFRNYNLSPDMRWLVMPGEATVGAPFTIHSIDTTAKPLDLTGVSGAAFSYQPDLQWTADSEYLIYSPSVYKTDAQGNRIIASADYHLIEVNTGEEITLVAGTVNNLLLVPGNKYIAYSKPRPGSLPSVHLFDYMEAESYYIYELSTNTTKYLFDGRIVQRQWSPDGKKFVYLKLVHNATSLLTQPFIQTNAAYNEQLPLQFTPQGLFFTQNTDFSLTMGVFDLTTGKQFPVNIPASDYYNLTWLPDSTSLLMTVYSDSTEMMSPNGLNNPGFSSYVVRLDGSAYVPLNLDDEERANMQTPTQEYQILLPGNPESGDYYVLNMPTGEIEPLKIPSGEVYFYSSWSLDGRYLALTTKVHPVNTLTPLQLSGTFSTATPSGGSLYITPGQIFRTYLIPYDNPTMRLIYEDHIASSLHWSQKGNSLFLNSKGGGQTRIYMLANPADPNDQLHLLYKGESIGRLTYLFYDSRRPGT